MADMRNGFWVLLVVAAQMCSAGMAEGLGGYKTCFNGCVDVNLQCKDKCENKMEVKNAAVRKNDPKRDEKIRANATEGSACAVACYNDWAVCRDNCGKSFPEDSGD
jgi:hypothetical protein